MHTMIGNLPDIYYRDYLETDSCNQKQDREFFTAQ